MFHNATQGEQFQAKLYPGPRWKCHAPGTLGVRRRRAGRANPGPQGGVYKRIAVGGCCGQPPRSAQKPRWASESRRKKEKEGRGEERTGEGSSKRSLKIRTQPQEGWEYYK